MLVSAGRDRHPLRLTVGRLALTVGISPYIRRLRERVGHDLVQLPSVAVLARDEEGRLLLVRENGELMLALASPKEFKPVAHAQLLPATVRAYPALADGMLYVRNEHNLACFKVK